MKARALLIGATFDRETMKVMFAAFDTAWAEIAHHFDGDPEVEVARLRLANAVLATVGENGTDVEALKKSALEVMALTAARTSS
jgi:hypothetical protein